MGGADGSPLAWLLKHAHQSPSYQDSKASSFHSELPCMTCLSLTIELFIFISNSHTSLTEGLSAPKQLEYRAVH